MPQIQHNPWGELCWYFPATREQFRLAGPLHLIDGASTDPVAQTARWQRWQSLSPSSRQSFTWLPPGQPRQGDLPQDVPAPDLPPAHFCLLWLHPQWVDHLELCGHPHNRYCYQRDANQTWTVQEVNP